MQYYEKGWNDPISIKKCDIFDLESENERLQKEAASYTRPIKRNNKIINEVDPKYESRVIEIADKITANKMRVTKIQIFLDEIDKMFKTFPDSLGTWENLIDQKQYLEKKPEILNISCASMTGARRKWQTMRRNVSGSKPKSLLSSRLSMSASRKLDLCLSSLPLID